MQVRFVSAATPDRIAVVAALADKVWNKHYTGLLAPAQIAYMVDKFQSAGAIARQIAQEGYRYFLLELDGRAVGYTAVQAAEGRLFLSKLYIEREARGQGAASQALAFLEGLVGKALRDGYREKTYVATKSPLSLLHTAEDFDRILDEQLERLGLPYVDFYMFHAINRQEWREKVLGFGLIPRIEAARAAGKIRYIGFSFHDDNDAFHEIVDGYDWDFCQIQYNYVDVNNQAGTVGLEYAAGKGLAVIVMEPLLGGKLALPPEGVRRVLPEEKTPVEWALDFIWDRPEVSLLLSGMGSAQQVRDNLVYASRSGKGMLTGEERALFAGAKEAYDTMAKVPCTKCAYCMPCPFGVDIPGVFDAYNRSAFSQEEGEARYAALEGKAELCRACRKCEKVCPQHIVISERLLEARQALDRVDNHQ